MPHYRRPRNALQVGADVIEPEVRIARDELLDLMARLSWVAERNHEDLKKRVERLRVGEAAPVEGAEPPAPAAPASTPATPAAPAAAADTASATAASSRRPKRPPVHPDERPHEPGRFNA